MEICFSMAYGMFKNGNEHRSPRPPRLMPNNCQHLDPPYCISRYQLPLNSISLLLTLTAPLHTSIWWKIGCLTGRRPLRLWLWARGRYCLSGRGWGIRHSRPRSRGTPACQSIRNFHIRKAHDTVHLLIQSTFVSLSSPDGQHNISGLQGWGQGSLDLCQRGRGQGWSRGCAKRYIF